MTKSNVNLRPIEEKPSDILAQYRKAKSDISSTWIKTATNLFTAPTDSWSYYRIINLCNNLAKDINANLPIDEKRILKEVMLMRVSFPININSLLSALMCGIAGYNLIYYGIYGLNYLFSQQKIFQQLSTSPAILRNNYLSFVLTMFKAVNESPLLRISLLHICNTIQLLKKQNNRVKMLFFYNFAKDIKELNQLIQKARDISSMLNSTHQLLREIIPPSQSRFIIEDVLDQNLNRPSKASYNKP